MSEQDNTLPMEPPARIWVWYGPDGSIWRTAYGEHAARRIDAIAPRDVKREVYVRQDEFELNVALEIDRAVAFAFPGPVRVKYVQHALSEQFVAFWSKDAVIAGARRAALERVRALLERNAHHYYGRRGGPFLELPVHVWERLEYLANGGWR